MDERRSGAVSGNSMPHRVDRTLGHIVTIYDVGQVQGYHFIAMKYLKDQFLPTLWGYCATT